MPEEETEEVGEMEEEEAPRPQTPIEAAQQWQAQQTESKESVLPSSTMMIGMHLKHTS